ncbi:Gag-Pol polyprotein [Gossypium australe]|uniref:Gag-Pol polyprotein n=1 Tax=Gossypium australe TaxID=47621 RepID=A0A5B6VCH5_9ROSI|nr:Gag-Pol polyprotein [Gossypium australe]
MMRIGVVSREKPSVDRIQKQEAEEFRASKEDDPERAEFWLENTIRAFDELSCTPEKCMKCVVSLLRDSAYQCQIFIDQKRKKFLELKQGKMTVTEYEREFVRLSKYAQECVSSEAIMCKRFEDGLNEYIKLFISVLELKEFVVLVDRACKAEDLVKEKRKAEMESRDSRKRQMSKTFQSSFKKSRDFLTRSITSARFSNKSKSKQYSGPKAQATSVASIGNPYPVDRSAHSMADVTPVNVEQMKKPASGRNPRSRASSKTTHKEQAARLESGAPVRTYAIRAREEASSLDVIMGIFSLYDTKAIALIDRGSNHSYICMKLVSRMSMLVESTKFVIKVSNPLGKSVLVDKVCKDCPLMIRGHYFKANLMILPFDEFDIILGMDWLTTHDVTANRGKKYIELRCENRDTLRVESDD